MKILRLLKVIVYSHVRGTKMFHQDIIVYISWKTAMFAGVAWMNDDLLLPLVWLSQVASAWLGRRIIM